MHRRIAVCLLVLGLQVATASAQLGGIVYDPTNYQNAVLRYLQLQQHLAELQKTYVQIVAAYHLALQMSRNLENMPARYRAQFSSWQKVSAPDAYGNTAGWVSGANSGLNVPAGYQSSTTKLGLYDPAALSGMSDDERARIESQYASVELADGVNTGALSIIGAIRGNAAALESRIGNLEEDSLSPEADLNSEVQVLNKINATGVLTLRSVQDSNKLLASLLEQQTIAAKQQREATANAINSEISRRASLAGNLNRVTGTLSDSLENFRMP